MYLEVLLYKTLLYRCADLAQKLNDLSTHMIHRHWIWDNNSAIAGFEPKTRPYCTKLLLHFVAFFHVASLISTEVDNRKVEVDNKKALELTNSTVFHRSRQWKSSRAGQQNIFFIFQPDFNVEISPKTSCCIVAWSRQTFWFKLNFLLPKNESVLNILVYFLEQFQIFSRGLQPRENL